VRALGVLLPLAAIAAVGGRALAGCGSTVTQSVFSPVTGVVVRSADLVGKIGCGMGPDQVYKYVVVAAYAASPGVPITSEVVPCYADGVLSGLAASDAGADFDAGIEPYGFKLYIYAYTYQDIADYDQGATPKVFECAGQNGVVSCPGDDPDATALPVAPGGQSNATVLPRFVPTWSTTCTAVEQLGIPALATCDPLTPLAINVPTGSFVRDDGGAFSCDAQYETVVGAWQAEGDAGASGSATVQCPAPVVVPRAAPGVPYTISLDLKGGAQPANAKTTCTGTAALGQTATAACNPVQLTP
jgi:hypothetical protein